VFPAPQLERPARSLWPLRRGRAGRVAPGSHTCACARQGAGPARLVQPHTEVVSRPERHMPRGLWDDDGGGARGRRGSSAGRRSAWDDDEPVPAFEGNGGDGKQADEQSPTSRIRELRGSTSGGRDGDGDVDDGSSSSDDGVLEVTAGQTVENPMAVRRPSVARASGSAPSRPPQQYEQPYQESPPPHPQEPSPPALPPAPPVALPIPPAAPPTSLPAATMATADVMDSEDVEALQGWLSKKHEHHKVLGSQWARRYFSINESYGTLNYSKSENKRASIMLPLCDIQKVERLEIEQFGPFCFLVSCPPASLTLKARDQDECQRWIRALTAHSTLWRTKGGLTATAAVVR